MFLGIVFICSIEYLVCFCAASLVEKERCNKTKWSYEKFEIAACVVGRARDCVRRSLAKVLFAVEGNKFCSHREFCVSGGCEERRVCLLLKLPRGELRARCRERKKAAHRHSQFWGDIKLFLCVENWMYLIHIQLGFLGLKDIDARNP